MEAFPTLGQCLIDTGLARLRIIARMWALEVTATRQVETAMELARALADPSHAARVWEGLRGEERSALAALLNAGGFMPAAAFSRRFGQIRPIGPGRLEREEPWRNPISPAECLWYRGLIYEGFARADQESYSAYFIPGELQSALPVKAEAAPVDLGLASVPVPPHHAYVGDLLLDDLTTLLAFIHNEYVRASSESGAWPDLPRAELSRYLRDRDAARLELCLHLVRHLGWTKMNEAGRLRLVAEPVMAWLQQPEEESRDQLVSAWLQSEDWNELWCLTHLEPDAVGTWRSNPELARSAMLRHLATLSSDEWVRVDDFVAAVKAIDPDFLRPAGKYDEWYVRDTESGAYLSGFESWDHVEGAVLRAILQGPASWLGLVESGKATANGPVGVFRPLSTSIIGATRAPKRGERTIVRPDLTILIPSHLRFDRFQLARVADLVSAGDIYIYRITPASLRRSGQQHIGLDRLLGFLQSLSEARLPQPVLAGLKQWYQNGTQVWLERKVLLRVANEEAMQRILALPRVSRYVGRALSSTAAVVAEKDWSDLITSLAESGFLVDLAGMGE